MPGLRTKIGEEILDFAVPLARRAGEALGILETRAPRPRQRPKIGYDNPGGEWLQRQRRRAAESGNPVSGAVTAYTRKPVMLDPNKVRRLPGHNAERRVPGEMQYDALRPSVEAHGLYPDSPILIGVNHEGAPYIIEGNTRTAVADDLGLPELPAEIRWFAGGEQMPDAMLRPDNIEEFMAQSELMRDPRFRKYFEGSKMIDQYGEPLKMYHGTKGDINIFDNGRIGQSDFGASGRGFYFSQDPSTAGLYAEMAKGIGNPNILPTYLSVRNPMELGAMIPRDKRESELLTQRALDLGHDAIIVRNPKDNLMDEVVVFDPRQIKSAIGNRGTYDPLDPDITKARGGLAVKPIWDKKRPKGLGKPKSLSAKQKKSAKAKARAAGRPYPNMIDNMAAAKKGK